MKKLSKYFIVTALLTMMVFVFAGCSEKKEENNKSTIEEKIVATKTITSNDVIGEYETRFEFTFENEKLTKVINTSELKNENQAEVFMAAMNASKSKSIEGIEFEQDGKKVIMKMDADTFSSRFNINSETLTKDAIKKDMERKGYTIK